MALCSRPIFTYSASLKAQEPHSRSWSQRTLSRPCVGTKGNPLASIVIVTDQPTKLEDTTKEPLSGPQGSLFHSHLDKGADIYVIQATECMSIGKKDEKRVNVAISACSQRLVDQIGAHPRKIIIALGNAAVRAVTGDHKLKITQIRGRIFASDLAEHGIMPMVSMGALMMGTGNYRQWKEDLSYAMHLGTGGSPKVHLEAKLMMFDGTFTHGSMDALFMKMTDGKRNMDLTCDLETSSLYWYDGRILTIGITPDHNKSIGFCFLPQHLRLLKKYFEDRTIKWAYHNGKFDVHWLRAVGINAHVDDDTMLMSYCLDENPGVHGLEGLSCDILGAPDYKDMLKPYLPNKKTSYEVIPLPILAKYQAIDTSNTAQLRTILRARVAEDPKLELLYTKTLIPASELLTWIETNGIKIDRQRILDNHEYFTKMMEAVGAEINEIIGYSINPNSFKQVKELLYTRMKFLDRYKGSTNEAALNDMFERTEHAIFPLLLKYRKANKMFGTYVKGLDKWIQPNGRIHCNYKLHGTKTGRLASNDPNLQNSPRLPQIRGSFVADEDCEILEIDLSQAELRILAQLSKDPVLIHVYQQGLDLHTDLAISRWPEWQALHDRGESGDAEAKAEAKEKRVKCKNVNFGIIYGITCFGLAIQMGCTVAYAQAMLDAWAKRYKVAWAFIQKCRAAPMKNQIITTPFGRKKRVGVVSRQNLMFLQNEAANFPPQSIASDITLHAAMRVMPKLKEYGVKIINTVHDSIIMEIPITPDDEIRIKTARLVKGTMESVPREWGLTAIPFVADAEIGQRWGSLKEYHIPSLFEDDDSNLVRI